MMASRRFFSLILVLAFGLVLAGCQQQRVRDLPSTQGATGSLGSPLVQQSPADVYIDLSSAYLREGLLTEAFKNARKAVIVDPSSSNAHYVQALVYQRLGQLDQAEASFRKSIALDGRNPVALNAHGSFLCGQQRYDEADAYFRRALNNPLYTTPWLAWHNAGSCSERAGDLERAESDYRAALRSNRGFPPSLLAMARISFDDGNFLSARGYLQRYEEVAKHTAESLWLGVRTENQLGDKDQMASYGLKLRARFPDSDQAKYLQSIE